MKNLEIAHTKGFGAIETGSCSLNRAFFPKRETSLQNKPGLSKKIEALCANCAFETVVLQIGGP